MPGVSAVVDGEGASEIEVEEAGGWECPLEVVKSIHDG